MALDEELFEESCGVDGSGSAGDAEDVAVSGWGWRDGWWRRFWCDHVGFGRLVGWIWHG